MLLDDYPPLLHGLGWLAALMFATVWASLQGGVGRRHAGWLIGFCTARLLVAAAGLVLAIGPEWRQLTSVLSGIVLWEFARRVWNDTNRRPVSALTHLLPAECLVLVGAVTLAGAVGGPAWFLPVDALYATLPGLLGGGATLLLWRCVGAETDPRRRAALRVALIGLGLYAVPGDAAGFAWSIFPPWIVTAGLGAVCLASPVVRTRAAFICATGLLLVAGIGPFAVAATRGQLESAEREDQLERVERAAAPLQGKLAAPLAADTLDPATRHLLRQYFEKLSAADSLVHSATLWRIRDGRLQSLDPATGDFGRARMAGADELEGATHSRPFIMPAASVGGRPLAIACAPLSPGVFETPTAWLVLQFPEIFWDVQRQHAHRTGIAIVGVLAAFCAMGFVLAARQRLETIQRLAVERAQSADQAKTEFLAFLSHEMRTPLQTILGRAELIRRESPPARRHADIVETQGRHLLRLVTDLLDLGTIEAGKLKLLSAPFALRPLLASLEETHGPAAALKGLALDIVTAPDVPDALVGDEARLRQILGNLLANAVKFTAHGTVTLRVNAGDSGPPTDDRNPNRSRLLSPAHRPLIFAVTDTGPGLPPERIPQLFTLFTRLDSGGAFTREGTGVGLALVRRLCGLMGGTVTAANRPEGGAEFVVRLAFQLPAPLPASLASLPQPGAHGLRVLVAEDNTAVREFLAEALAGFGHHVESVVDGPATLAACTAREFDVVVLDVNLPGRDGVTIARQLAVHPRRPRLVGCSAEAFAATRDAALAAGMDVFLEKPVTLDALTAALSPVASSSATVFDRLNSSMVAARTRALLSEEWPRLHAEAASALAAGESAPLHRLAHYVQSSALLLADSALTELCRRLSRAADPGTADNARVLLAEIDQHLGAWPELNPSASLSSATIPAR